MRLWSKVLGLAVCCCVVAVASGQKDDTKGPVGTQPGKAGGPQFDANRFLKDHDTNKDGKLGKDELPAAAQDDFAQLDANRDGSISADELQKHAELMAQQRPQLIEVFFYAIDIPEDEPATVQEIQEAYDQLRKLDRNNDGKIDDGELKTFRETRKKERIDSIFTGLDKNKDAKISKDEARGLWADGFTQLDKNNDGMLDRQEVEAACAMKADVPSDKTGNTAPPAKK